jgi:hypothetical protein
VSTPAVHQGAVDLFWDAIETASPTFVADAAAAATRREGSYEYERAAFLLRSAHPDLRLFLAPTNDPESGRAEVVISAQGQVKAFDAARAVVDAAPTAVRERFTVHALRPPVTDPDHLRLVVGATPMFATDVHWTATPVVTRRSQPPSTKVDLTLHLAGWLTALPDSSVANERLATPALHLLDLVLGEWAVEMAINSVSFTILTADADLPDLLALPARLHLTATA